MFQSLIESIHYTRKLSLKKIKIIACQNHLKFYFNLPKKEIVNGNENVENSLYTKWNIHKSFENEII